MNRSNMKFKISKSQWEEMGKKAGWMRKVGISVPFSDRVVSLTGNKIPQSVLKEIMGMSVGLNASNAKNAVAYAFKMNKSKLYSGQFIFITDFYDENGNKNPLTKENFDGYIKLSGWYKTPPPI